MVTDGYYPGSETGVPLSRFGPCVTLQTRGFGTLLDRNQSNVLGVEMHSRVVARAGIDQTGGPNEHEFGVSQQRLV